MNIFIFIFLPTSYDLCRVVSHQCWERDVLSGSRVIVITLCRIKECVVQSVQIAWGALQTQGSHRGVASLRKVLESEQGEMLFFISEPAHLQS